ncbi:MAG TPA: serine/threonine-protein kinase [Solirubrobacteraceae bacterium]|nr:serine/threonine-protein kinase [Solirubrobacteraceae bacterium]
MSASELPTERRGRVLPQTEAAETALAPLVLGRYRLRRRLGAGAFGTVWAAQDERLEREVAVKILPRERIIGGRFEREARATARLSHPAIVTLYEAAVDDEGAYLVSELVRGPTLARALAAGKLSDKDIVRLGVALCDALAHAHAEGVIHRDVKPSNVLIPARPTTGAYPAKLTDFGIARVVGGDSLTGTGDVMGTAAYMAPEQAEGRPVGAEADLYALAIVLYESLTGINPVREGTAATRARRLGTYLPPLRRQRRDLPRELGAGIDLALRPRPRERGTLHELRTALERSLPEAGERAGVVAPSWRPTARRDDDHAPSRRRTVRLGAAEVGDAEELDESWGRTAGRPEPELARSVPDVRFVDAPPQTIPWPARATATAGAAGTAAWLASVQLLPTGVPPAAYALLAALAVLVFPRAGWIGLAITLAGLCAGGHRAGAALVIGPLLLLPAALLPRRGRAWSLPAGAVALGLVGLGGAWPAVAARSARSLWRRAVLGACGFVWLAAAGQLAGSNTFLRRAASAPAPRTWTASLTVAVRHVVPVLTAPGVLAGALVWGLAAVVLPWLTRGGTLALEAVLVTIWSGSLVSATAVAVALGGADRAPAGTVAVVGAVAGGLVALLPALLRARRVAAEHGGIDAQFP